MTTTDVLLLIVAAELFAIGAALQITCTRLTTIVTAIEAYYRKRFGIPD